MKRYEVSLRIQSECGEMREKADQNNSEYRLFLCSFSLISNQMIFKKDKIIKYFIEKLQLVEAFSWLSLFWRCLFQIIFRQNLQKYCVVDLKQQKILYQCGTIIPVIMIMIDIS